MKVRSVIATLARNYDLDQEIMAFWVGSNYKEMKAGAWDIAVEIWDSEDNLATFQDYINDIITDAEIQLEKAEHKELAIDTYLADLAEKELESENI
jgi:hypothetical protein